MDREVMMEPSNNPRQEDEADQHNEKPLDSDFLSSLFPFFLFLLIQFFQAVQIELNMNKGMPLRKGM